MVTAQTFSCQGSLESDAIFQPHVMKVLLTMTYILGYVQEVAASYGTAE